MYVPEVFRIEDLELIRHLVDTNPFATVVTTVDGELEATPIPLHRVPTETGDVLLGHVARPNRLALGFGRPAVALFGGPHGYVSPAWYETSPNVPTWNYVAVHAHGVPEIIEDEQELVSYLRELTRHFDPELEATHPQTMGEDLIVSMLRGLIAFRMPVTQWEAKAKLNQNKKPRDRHAVRDRYLDSERPEERAMGALMADLND